MCVDTTVGYNCSCFSGFQFASDMKNCTELGVNQMHSMRMVNLGITMLPFVV